MREKLGSIQPAWCDQKMSLLFVKKNCQMKKTGAPNLVG